MLGLFCPKRRKVQKHHQQASDFALLFQNGKNATTLPQILPFSFKVEKQRSEVAFFFEVQKRQELASDLVVQFRLFGCLAGSTAFATGGPNPGRLCPPPRLGFNASGFGFGVWGLRFRGYIRGVGFGV